MAETRKQPLRWPLISIGSGLAASLFLWLLYSALDWRLYMIAGAVVFLFVLALNPVLRYYRVGMAIVGIFSIVQSVGYTFSGELFGQEYLVFSQGFTTGVSIALIFLAGLVFILDFMERKGKGIPPLSIQVHLNRQKTQVEGDQINIHGDQTNIEGPQVNLHWSSFSGEHVQVAGTIINHPPQSSNPLKPPKDLTDVIPRRLLSTITGRGAKLKELRSMILTGQKVAVVNGMGGIGKTTLAETYLGEYYHEYAHIAWITQKDENLSFDFAAQAYLIKSLGIETGETDPFRIFQEIMRGMKSLPDSPCLLVVDNALKSIEKFLDFLPKGPKWHVLITSRSKPENIPCLNLAKLSSVKSLELFQKLCPRKYDPARIEALLEAIEHHTLTVELLAKTAKAQHLSIERLETAILRDQQAGVSLDHNQKEEVERVTGYLSRVFALAQLSEHEKWVLKQWTCLPLTFIQYETLQKLLAPEEHGLEESFGKILNDLSSKGLLQSDDDKDSYKIHSLIADLVWTDLNTKEEDLSSLIQNVTELLRIDQAIDNPIDKFVWEPFGNTIAARFPDSTAKTITHLQNNLALVLQALGDYVGARDLLEKAMVSYEKNFGVDHPNTALSHSNLAIVLQDLGDFVGAKGLLEKAMVSNEKNFGEDHPTTAVSYSNLATVLRDLGDYVGAKGLLEKAMVSYEKNFGVDHPKTAVRYSNLATVLQDLGDYVGAKALLEKAMLTNEKHLGGDHPTTAVSYSNLALVLQDLVDYVGAQDLLEKAMVSDEKNFGVDHPNTAVSYSNLAVVLQALGDCIGAKGLLEKAMVSDEKNFGVAHPTTAVRYSNLGMVLHDLGDDVGAKDLLEKAIEIFKKCLPEGHPSIQIVQNNLNGVLGRGDKS